MIKNLKSRYIRNANILEDTAKEQGCNVAYTVGTDNISLVVTHGSLAKKLVVICTNSMVPGKQKYQKHGLSTVILCNDDAMMRIAIDEIRTFKRSMLV